MLTGNEIIKRVMMGQIRIDPFNLSNIGPNSYDLRLSNKLLVYSFDVLDSKGENKTKEIIIPENGYVLQPNILYLGSTVEYTGSDNFIPILHGRSSIARLGMFTHLCAGFGDLGWYGTWTLEIRVIHPIRIYPNMRVCQVSFQRTHGTSSKYSGKYQDQKDPTPSKLWMDKFKESNACVPLLVSDKLKSEIIGLCCKDTKQIAFIPWDKRYCVSDRGDVISLCYKNKPKLLNHFFRKDGEYPHVQIVNNKIAVHKLVIASFIGQPGFSDGMIEIIRHKDGNPKNCVLDNLTYGTYKENSDDAIKHGKIHKGSSNHQSKLTEDEVLEIRRIRYERGVKIKDLAKDYCVSEESIRRILHRTAWFHLDDGLGILCHSKYGKHYKLNKEDEVKILEMVNAGHRYKDIAEYFNISIRAVNYRIKKFKKKGLIDFAGAVASKSYEDFQTLPSNVEVECPHCGVTYVTASGRNGVCWKCNKTLGLSVVKDG